MRNRIAPLCGWNFKIRICEASKCGIKIAIGWFRPLIINKRWNRYGEGFLPPSPSIRRRRWRCLLPSACWNDWPYIEATFRVARIMGMVYGSIMKHASIFIEGMRLKRRSPVRRHFISSYDNKAIKIWMVSALAIAYYFHRRNSTIQKWTDKCGIWAKQMIHELHCRRAQGALICHESMMAYNMTSYRSRSKASLFHYGQIRFRFHENLVIYAHNIRNRITSPPKCFLPLF